MDLYEVLKTYSIQISSKPKCVNFLGFEVLCTKEYLDHLINNYDVITVNKYVLLEINGIRFRISSYYWNTGSKDRVHLGRPNWDLWEARFIINGKSNK